MNEDLETKPGPDHGVSRAPKAATLMLAEP